MLPHPFLCFNKLQEDRSVSVLLPIDFWSHLDWLSVDCTILICFLLSWWVSMDIKGENHVLASAGTGNRETLASEWEHFPFKKLQIWDLSVNLMRYVW